MPCTCSAETSPLLPMLAASTWTARTGGRSLPRARSSLLPRWRARPPSALKKGPQYSPLPAQPARSALAIAPSRLVAALPLHRRRSPPAGARPARRTRVACKLAALLRPSPPPRVPPATPRRGARLHLCRARPIARPRMLPPLNPPLVPAARQPRDRAAYRRGPNRPHRQHPRLLPAARLAVPLRHQRLPLTADRARRRSRIPRRPPGIRTPPWLPPAIPTPLPRQRATRTARPHQRRTRTLHQPLHLPQPIPHPGSPGRHPAR